MMQKVLIVGIEGTIGKGLSHEFIKIGIPFIGSSRTQSELSQIELNLEDLNSLEIPNDLSHVILCAGITNQKYCEENYDESYKINVEAQQQLIKKIPDSCVVIYLSSDTVFSQNKPRFYPNSELTPTNTYSKQKAQMETFVKTRKNHLILRLGKVFSDKIPLFDEWYELISREKEISAFEDYFCSPISLEFLCETIGLLIRNEARGTHHISSRRSISYYDLAKYWATLLGLNYKLISPALSAENSQVVSHKKGTLDCQTTVNITGKEMPCPEEAIHLSALEKIEKNKSSSNCHVCGGELKSIDISELRYVSSDCKPNGKASNIAICTTCQTVQKEVNSEFKENCTKIYSQYEAYYQAKGAEQQVFDQDGVANNRSYKILKNIKHLLPSKGSLLDFGCGNGNLLRSAGKLLTNWNFSGFELDKRTKEEVLSIENCTHFYTDLRDVDNKFDVISLIHVLEHIDSPQNLLNNLSNCLKDSGLLLIQVPDFQENPFDLLIADHCTHFSFSTMKNLLNSCGLNISYISGNCISKEITVLAGKGKVAEGPVQNENAKFAKAVNWLKQLNPSIQSLAEKTDFYIFGSSIAAVAAWQLASDKIKGFIDEDTSRQGNQLFDLPIVSPEQLTKNDIVFCPLAPCISQIIFKKYQSKEPIFITLSPYSNWTDVNTSRINTVLQLCMQNSENKLHDFIGNDYILSAQFKKIFSLPEFNKGKLAIYGAGQHTKRFMALNLIDPSRICNIFDDHPSSDSLEEIKVVPVSEAAQTDFDFLLISSDSYDTQLTEKALSWCPRGKSIISLYQQKVYHT